MKNKESLQAIESSNVEITTNKQNNGKTQRRGKGEEGRGKGKLKR